MKRKFSVFINPGHSRQGKPDPGAVNHILGLRECDIAESIGYKLSEYLFENDVNTITMQDDNLCGELGGASVCGSANTCGADVFVSIHCNAFNGMARGFETLCYSEQSGGFRLAQKVHAGIALKLGTIDAEMPDRGIKERPDLAVLRETSMPAVLVELGFIDNPQDAWILEEKQDELARAICEGIMSYERTWRESHGCKE